MDEKKRFPERIEKLREILPKKRLDAAVLFSGESCNDLSSKNTYYLSGFFDSWPHAVILTKNDAVLFTGEPERAEKESAIKDIRETKKNKIEGFLKKNRLKKIGIDLGFSYARGTAMKQELKNVKFTDISREMTELRAIKDSGEIAKIRLACGITAKALETVRENVKISDEGALAKKINSEFVNNGAENAFKPVVSGDANSANIHYFACNCKYKKLVMADIGARRDFYNSDFTRTFILGNGREMIRARELLEHLMGELSDLIRPGMKCFDAFNYAKKFLQKGGYKKESFANFQSLGHGVGLDVHEYPILTGNALFRKMRFEENMVFTLEPALYFKRRFGVRIEDTVMLGKDGVRRLYSESKNF